jgi:hypothetical protein
MARKQGQAAADGVARALRWVYSASAGVDVYPRWLLDAPLVTCGRGVASEEIADDVIAAIYLQEDLERVRARSLSQWKQAPLGRVAQRWASSSWARSAPPSPAALWPWARRSLRRGVAAIVAARSKASSCSTT